MKRFHVNLTVSSLDDSVGFYTKLFAAPPRVRKDDYAKWMLDDPRINFSLTTHGSRAGIDHVGLQAEDDEEFTELRSRLASADTPVLDQEQATCCYAVSTKAWVRDPDGLAWETFLSRGESVVYGDGRRESAFRVAEEREGTVCCDTAEGQREPESDSCCRPAI